MLAMFRSDEICTASWAGGDPTWPDQPRGSKCDVGLTGDVLEASCPVVRQLNVGQVPFTVFLSAERALALVPSASACRVGLALRTRDARFRRIGSDLLAVPARRTRGALFVRVCARVRVEAAAGEGRAFVISSAPFGVGQRHRDFPVRPQKPSVEGTLRAGPLR